MYNKTSEMQTQLTFAIQALLNCQWRTLHWSWKLHFLNRSNVICCQSKGKQWNQAQLSTAVGFLSKSFHIWPQYSVYGGSSNVLYQSMSEVIWGHKKSTVKSHKNLQLLGAPLKSCNQGWPLFSGWVITWLQVYFVLIFNVI